MELFRERAKEKGCARRLIDGLLGLDIVDEKWASDTKAYIKWECQDA